MTDSFSQGRFSAPGGGRTSVGTMPHAQPDHSTPSSGVPTSVGHGPSSNVKLARMPHRPIHKSSHTHKEFHQGEHRFEHWYVDNQLYFITSRCRDGYLAFL